MKRLYQFSALLLLVSIYSCSSSRYYQSTPQEYSQDYQQQPTITYQQFYNDLSPYGDWINYGDYGYVWIPNQFNFRPYYTNGYWAYTDYGWTWVSNYTWGWAPFHYGRWINDRSYGWMWVPGNEWAPAWVAWRGGGDYYGWAPLEPGMNPNLSDRSIPYNDWTFVPRRYINSPRINNYYVDHSRNVTIINNTNIINNTTVINQDGRTGRNRAFYNPGPSSSEVENTTGAKIRKFNVVQSGKPEAPRVTNNSISLFRPAVNPEPASNANSHPEKVVNLDEIRATHPTNPQNTHDINKPSAPVREFPKDQTPQINRNEPPVKTIPSVTPNRNNAPARVFPDRNNNEPENRNPVNRNEEKRPVNPPANIPSPERPDRNTPERTFPDRNNTYPAPANPGSPDNLKRSGRPPQEIRQEERLNSNTPARIFPDKNNQPENSNQPDQNEQRRPDQAPQRNVPVRTIPGHVQQNQAAARADNRPEKDLHQHSVQQHNSLNNPPERTFNTKPDSSPNPPSKEGGKSEKENKNE